MAAQPSEKALVDELAIQREEMAEQLAVLREKLDVPAQVKGSVATHPAAWFAGAAILGFLLAQIPRGRREREHVEVPSRRRAAAEKPAVQPLKHTLLLLALKSAADYAKPFLLNLMKQQLMAHAQPPATRAPQQGAEQPVV